MADETVHFPQKSREIRGEGKWKAVRQFASKPSLAYSFPLDAEHVCACVARCRTRHCPLITISCMFECTTHIYISARAVLDLGIKGSVRHSYHVKYMLTEQARLSQLY